MKAEFKKHDKNAAGRISESALSTLIEKLCADNNLITKEVRGLVQTTTRGSAQIPNLCARIWVHEPFLAGCVQTRQCAWRNPCDCAQTMGTNIDDCIYLLPLGVPLTRNLLVNLEQCIWALRGSRAPL